ncbi:MAG: hypothetical protein COT85_05010 [Chlamydiae bacterium CG10_big_fil_rev_8_21_14_0_10_42_34]|nr:MAG: hypothetical protein COT85_05010 [Chlamydiae bacterium CG10_big_fil_rev_8_21_14_0_10_42_34]
MIRTLLSIFFFLSVSSLSATFIGNPAQPGLLEKSIIRKKPSWWSFRAGYLDDWIYKQRFQDEFKLQGVTHTRTFMKLSTYAALLTLNLKDRIDFYGIVGSSRMQIDQEIFTKRALSWGVGGKLILFKHGNFFLGADAKYFETNQKPRYFVVDGLAYNIESNYRLKYHAMQGALGISYRAWIFAPYINCTYILTHIEPEPAVLYVRLPDVYDLVDVESKSVVGQKKWGLALGLTLVDALKASLSVEWRAINQNAVDVNFSIRF